MKIKLKFRKITSVLLTCAMLLSLVTLVPAAPSVTVSATTGATEYRCGNIISANGAIGINDAVHILMALAKMQMSEVLKSVSARRAALITSASRGNPTVLTYLDDSEIEKRNVSINDAVHVLMYLAKMSASDLNKCSTSGCDWCVKSGCPGCGDDDCPAFSPPDHGTILPKGAGVTANFRNLTATQLVSEIKTGWNLGNTFDSHDERDGTMGHDLHSNLVVLETRWVGNQNFTTQTLIQRVKELGFDTIRIPVTWYKAADPNNNLKIREDYMTRIKTVVNWAVAEGLYIILNTHHEESVMPLNDSGREHTINVVTRFWEQIAEEFKDYDEKLIFEGLNEPRNKSRPNSFDGGTAEERANLNIFNQTFVDTVRASGGNNAYRILMVPTYAAGAVAAAFNGFTIPNDTAENTTNGVSHKIALSIHTYTPEPFCFPGTTVAFDPNRPQNTDAITIALNRVRQNAERLGVPVILGEWGSSNKNNTAARAAHAEFYVKAAFARGGMKCVWWDNRSTIDASAAGRGESFGLITRTPPHAIFSTPAAGSFEPVVEGIMRGARCAPPKVPAPVGPR